MDIGGHRALKAAATEAAAVVVGLSAALHCLRRTDPPDAWSIPRRATRRLALGAVKVWLWHRSRSVESAPISISTLGCEV